MKVRSKGLGRIELLFDMEKLNFEREDGHLIITGKTLRPVIWDFRIAVSEEEVPALVKIAFRKPVRSLVAGFVSKTILFKKRSSTEEVGGVHKDVFR